MDHDQRPALQSYEDVAGAIEQVLVDPALTEDQLRDGCLMAIEYGVSGVIVRPSDLDIALRTIRGTSVKLGSVVGFPHGTANTAVKLYEARDLIRRGAVRLEVVVNPSKLIARQWVYVETEMLQMAQVCKESSVELTAVLESPILNEEHKIVACRICKRAAVDFVATATGYAGPFTSADLALYVRKCDPWIKVKASGPIAGIDDVLAAWKQGASRFSSRRVEPILVEWKKRLAAKPPEAVPAAPTGV
jgi:deoxyribose-phosphate aldolase